MKAIEFIYQDTVIEFMVNPQSDNVMVNATEMAKAYNKRIDDFTRLSSTQDFISALVSHLNREDNHAHLRDYVVEDVINSSKKRGTYMHRILALKFAAWLNLILIFGFSA